MITNLIHATMGLTPKQVLKSLFVMGWSLLLLLCAIVIIGVLNETATDLETARVLQKGLVIFSIPPVLTVLYVLKRIFFK